MSKIPDNVVFADCEKHGEQIVLEAGSSWGYAGPIYWAKLACGCQLVDASRDVPEP